MRSPEIKIYALIRRWPNKKVISLNTFLYSGGERDRGNGTLVIHSTPHYVIVNYYVEYDDRSYLLSRFKFWKGESIKLHPKGLHWKPLRKKKLRKAIV